MKKLGTWDEIQEFTSENDIPCVGNEQDLFDVATSHVALDGLWMEFGVATGRTTNYIAGKAPGVVYGFDSFEGLPEDFTLSVRKGHFKQEKPPNVAKNIQLETGLFQDTLEGFLAVHRKNVAYVHLDADLYSSTRYVLFALAGHGRIREGTIIQLDDVFYFEPGQNAWYTDEFRAFFEFVDEFGVEFKWLGYSGQRAAVKITKIELPITGFTPYREQVIVALGKGCEGSLGDVASVIWHTWEKGRQICICGNGGSAATAIHFASDLRSIGIPAWDLHSPAKITQIGNDSQFSDVFLEQIPWMSLVVAFSCSGTSENIMRACTATRASILFTSTMKPEVSPANLTIKVRSSDYEVIEDIHLMMCHALKKMLKYRMEHP